MSTTPPGLQRFDDTPADARHAGLRIIRRYHDATVGLFERRSDAKFFIDPASGHIVMPVEPGFAKSGTDGVELILYCPAESDCVVQIAAQPTEIARPESEECVDRWLGAHGPTARSTWIRARIEGAKTDDRVFDADELNIPNPLGRAEYGLIRSANAEPARLAQACKAHAAVVVAEPRCVGVDPLGVDVKARFGIVRLEFPPGLWADTPDAAARELSRLLGR
jgi:hypothetical protein